MHRLIPFVLALVIAAGTFLFWGAAKGPYGRLSFFLCLLALPSRAAELRAGKCHLTLLAGKSPELDFAARPETKIEFTIRDPLGVRVVGEAGNDREYTDTYSIVEAAGESLRCEGRITTTAGSVFHFIDIYATAGDGFEMNRRVEVEKATPGDHGFLSRFSLSRNSGPPLRAQELFIPGICYQKNTNVPAHAIAADLTEEDIVVREDRIPLPLVMLRDPADGVAASIIHLEPDGATCKEDANPARLIDGRLQFASLGVQGQAAPALTLLFPGTEGGRTYLRPRGRRRETKGWSERFHPVERGVRHVYKLRIDIGGSADFPAAMRDTWRTAFEWIHPPVAKTDIAASYQAGMRLVADWAGPHDGHPGLPFRLKLPEGRLEGKEHLNFQMGFVGQQLPLAYHLIRQGIDQDDESLIHKGEAMVDFWAEESLTPPGLPRTWFDTQPEPHWRKNNTFMRVASDGMMGALRAWDIMESKSRHRPQWLRFCHRFGDWLVQHQNADGSWFREFRWDGTPANTGKQNTCHPIPFLLGLAQVTGEKSYRDAALRAAEFCWQDVHQAFAYLGGTADNPNVTDKEAGFLAVDAFLALHDVTGDPRWLEAAARAADFTETWAYCWNVPMPTDDPATIFAKGAPTTGFSVIATGHSGADLFLAGAPFLYYRLYLKTGETHYAAIARQLLYDTKQSVDLDGSLGYGHTGLCTEAVSIASPRGRGVNTWLPWLTYSMVDPVANLRDAFRMTDPPTVDRERLEQLRALDLTYGRTRGLRSTARP